VSRIFEKPRSVSSKIPLEPSDSEERAVDVYFSADVETDGPIPGPFSILSFALVYAGRFDGNRFERAAELLSFYRELKPISDSFESEALKVNGLDRSRLMVCGETPETAMRDASIWVSNIAKSERPVLVAYPLCFDWSWLYWYFVQFCPEGSPFGHSRCFDIKTAVALKAHLPIAAAGRSQLPLPFRSERTHSHNALDDATEQAEIFAKVFESEGPNGEGPRRSSK
jgi:hypothetical protein